MHVGVVVFPPVDMNQQGLESMPTANTHFERQGKFHITTPRGYSFIIGGCPGGSGSNGYAWWLVTPYAEQLVHKTDPLKRLPPGSER